MRRWLVFILAGTIHICFATFTIMDNPFQYSTQYTEEENVNLQYLNARYYDAGIRRFMERDSEKLDNRYFYADDNPIRYSDPSGHRASVAKILMLTGLAVGSITFPYNFMNATREREFLVS